MLKMVNWKGNMPYRQARKHSGFCVWGQVPNAQHFPSSTYLVWDGVWGAEHLLWVIVFALWVMVVVSGSPSGLGTAEFGSTSPIVVQPWEREYITPIIGSDLMGSQAIPHVNL